jgi:hypothetical protein
MPDAADADHGRVDADQQREQEKPYEFTNDGDVATRKAALQVLVQEVRVDSREAITPYFRVPLHAPVRTLTRSERETRLELATLTLAR